MTSSSSSGGKKFLIGVGILAVAGIVYVSVNGITTSQEGAEGAIGAVERYRTDQMSSEDVVLEDPEFQAFMQTDEFHRLIEDEAFIARRRGISRVCQRPSSKTSAV